MQSIQEKRLTIGKAEVDRMRYFAVKGSLSK